MIDLIQNFITNEIIGSVVLFGLFLIVLVYAVFSSLGIGLEGTIVFLLVISFQLSKTGIIPSWGFYALLFLSAFIWYFFLRSAMTQV